MSVADKKAVILLSGGLDSATVLAIAKDVGYECYAMSFDYGQRHAAELQAAERIAKQFAVKEWRVVPVNLGSRKGSALTDLALEIPEQDSGDDIPITYVPARNTIFLSLALGWAEVLKVHDIFIGVNAVDYSGYPDCRPEYIEAFENMANLATKEAVMGQKLSLHTPLIKMSKAEIIQTGAKLGVDYSMTVSCYTASSEGLACGKCESCQLRKVGFKKAGVQDPTGYLD